MKSHRNLGAVAGVLTLAMVATSLLPVTSFAAQSSGGTGGRGSTAGNGGNGGTGSTGGTGGRGAVGGSVGGTSSGQGSTGGSGNGSHGSADDNAYAITSVVPPNCEGNCRHPHRPVPVPIVVWDRNHGDCMLRRFETEYGDTILRRVCDQRFH